MTKIDGRTLKNNAAAALREASYSPKKLVLIHAGVSAGLSLLILVISFVLELRIEGTGGLGGISNRAMLESAQSMLQLVSAAVLPFWSMGLISAMLLLSRREKVGPGDLLSGFRHFGPVLRGKILHSLVLAGALFLGCYLGTMIFSFSPLSASLYNMLEPYIVDDVIDYTAAMQDEAFAATMATAIPFALGGMLLVALPLFYRLRMMDYLLMDEPERGAVYAMQISKLLMRRRRLALLRLDLSFWWFYLLALLVVGLSYGDLILALLGVDLGTSAELAYFFFYILALAAQLGLYVWKKPLLQATYVGFYLQIRAEAKAEAAAKAEENNPELPEAF